MGSRILAFGLLLAITAATPASAQVEAIGGGVLVGQLVSDLTSSVKEIIDDVEDAYSSSAFVTREQLQVLIWELETMGTGLVGTAFRELNQTQRKFFQNTHNMVEAWNSGNREALKQVSGLLAQANDSIGTLPFAYRKPRVTGFAPHYLDSRRERAVIRISGSWLGAESPTLQLAGSECRRTGKIESKLTFSCPTQFQALDEPSEFTGKLVVFERQSFWSELVSLFREPPKRTYEITLTALPPFAGSYSASFVTEEKLRETRPRTQRFEHRNDHCQRSRNKTWNFSATSGWKIDMDTVRVSHRQNDESAWQGVHNLTEAGFQAKAVIRNQGDCGPVWVDGRGRVWGTARWTEYRDTSVPASINGPGGKLSWGNDAEIILPQAITSYAVTVDLMDGTRRILTGAEPHRWLRLIDESPNRLVLRVSDLTAALH